MGNNSKPKQEAAMKACVVKDGQFLRKVGKGRVHEVKVVVKRAKKITRNV
jgi:hypothetical protein